MNRTKIALSLLKSERTRRAMVEASKNERVRKAVAERVSRHLLAKHDRSGRTSGHGEILFARGVPPPEAFPTEELAECFESALREDAAGVLRYDRSPGYGPLRRELAEWYGVSEGEALVGSGSSLRLLALLSARLVGPGAVVYTEQPSYDVAIETFRRLGARVVGVPLEEDGINVERLEAAVSREEPAFLYLVPDFQNPTGATLSLEKRRRVVELAHERGFWVIEDTPYRQLRYRGQAPPLLREVEALRVITLGSFSKLLGPGLRVGFAIAPPGLIRAVTTSPGEGARLPPVLPTQAAVAEYLRRGWLGPNIERLKGLYAPRWEAMAEAVRRELPGARAFTPDGGFFVGVTLPESAHTDGLVGRARERGLALTPGAPFFADPDDGEPVPAGRFVRLPFCALAPEQIEEGVSRLAGLL